MPHRGASRRLAITEQPVSTLRPAPRRLRKRGKRQLEALKDNIARFGCLVPVLVTGTGQIIDGHAIWEACTALGHDTIPTIIIDDLSEAEVRALSISLNKLAERSEWDLPALKAEFEWLFEVDASLVPFTGFEMPQIDSLLFGSASDDKVPEPAPGPAVSQLGDLWLFEGGHKLLCANSREIGSYEALLGSERAQMVLTDPPYGCAIKNNVSRSHGEFVEGSGMSEPEARDFFRGFLQPLVSHLQDGAIVDLFIDWRGMMPLITALREVGLEQKTLCVWDKESGAMGGLYRQQTEFVIIAKWGKGPHINNIALGKHGRNRTTLWPYPGLSRFGRGRKEALDAHPTVKPIGLVADAILDCSHPGGIVLDPFAGSGTTLLAAHRTRRIARAIELDPAYVDVAVGRMEELTGAPARHAETGLTFAETVQARAAAETAE